jgi:hypothetical protein
MNWDAWSMMRRKQVWIPLVVVGVILYIPVEVYWARHHGVLRTLAIPGSVLTGTAIRFFILRHKLRAEIRQRRDAAAAEGGPD